MLDPPVPSLLWGYFFLGAIYFFDDIDSLSYVTDQVTAFYAITGQR